MRRCLLSLLTLPLLGSCVFGQEKATEFTITIKADKDERQDVPLLLPLSLRREFADEEQALELPAQLFAKYR